MFLVKYSLCLYFISNINHSMIHSTGKFPLALSTHLPANRLRNWSVFLL